MFVYSLSGLQKYANNPIISYVFPFFNTFGFSVTRQYEMK